MNYPKISVIVPVYNVAEFLPQCLESLTRQTLQDLEVILVNDGSTDGSAEILRNYVGKDGRFRLVERVNGGYSAARNSGLKEARGEYIGFVDADDWVEPDMFEHLLGLAENEHADIALCGFSHYLDQAGLTIPQDNTWLPPLLKRSKGHLRGAEALLFEDIAIWKNIYRRALLKSGDLIFDENMAMAEDIPFHLSALCLAGKIAASDRRLYFYRKQRPGQQTAIRDRRLFAYFQIFEKMEDLLHGRGLAYLQPWMLHLQISRHCLGYEMASLEIRQEYFQKIRRVFTEAGITPDTPIAHGCWQFGSIQTRLRWLVLRFLHPLTLQAVLSGDQLRFDRIIWLRKAVQNPWKRKT